ncbi:Histone-lysine N-methyltransferase [Abeliophyllum distichum]|uniref:Histone-lysine N-methyltransferase n=1 Tax=Abeliophyllum distichum TaxID=126358 RepID=A0ABD1QGW0_9LAMI
MNHNGLVVATSIVASGGYADDMENGDVLMNSLSTKTPVRVVRGWKETRASESPDSRAEIVSTYIYDASILWKSIGQKQGITVAIVQGDAPTLENANVQVSQRGIKFQLEIFKTESRGWGVRCLTFIPSGSFICEYAGELLEDKEAEQRIGNDEYLFDIGQNYNDSSLKPEESVNLIKFWEEDGFTIDAAQYGNIGRFINHSCSPNLYAQNVIYDHDDKRMPHVMLFAARTFLLAGAYIPLQLFIGSGS